ncbi:RES family NAD+ phosphorylase [Micropruina sp.]|uniref:RES family NAD+ phosphorylase n=1 Tax=Micropruina sp. TaxID=2737536 RepID=UPI0039E654F2
MWTGPGSHSWNTPTVPGASCHGKQSPRRVRVERLLYRQVDSRNPPLFHSGGAPKPIQPSGRWNRVGLEYAQYFAHSARGAWAEAIRYFHIRGKDRLDEMTRDMWAVWVACDDIADLATFDDYAACGLDPAIAVEDDHARAQSLGHELRRAGFRGVQSPSASLSGAVNLTLFGERYEYQTDQPAQWSNPDPDLWVPVELVAERASPIGSLMRETRYHKQPHLGLCAWQASKAQAKY